MRSDAPDAAAPNPACWPRWPPERQQRILLDRSTITAFGRLFFACAHCSALTESAYTSAYTEAGKQKANPEELA